MAPEKPGTCCRLCLGSASRFVIYGEKTFAWCDRCFKEVEEQDRNLPSLEVSEEMFDVHRIMES